MRIRKRLLPFIIAFLIFCVAIGELVYFVDPSQPIIFYTFMINPVFLFLVLVFFASYMLFTYIFLNSIKGVLFSLFVVLVLVLRMFGYTNWSYGAILFFIIILCIFLFPKRLRSALRGGRSD